MFLGVEREASRTGGEHVQVEVSERRIGKIVPEVHGSNNNQSLKDDETDHTPTEISKEPSCPPPSCDEGSRIPNLMDVVKSKLSDNLGRFSNEEQLLQSYHRLKDRKKPEFVLISGPSGSGKTHSAKTLRKIVNQDGGMFVIGTFDQLQRPEPYSAFVTAFTEFATLIDQEGPDKLSSLQNSILAAVGEGATALIDMIPALEHVMGRHDGPSLKNRAEAMSRFVLVFRMFVRAVCSPTNPLVFVLDNMQWADTCSLDLLASLVTDMESNRILIVGTCEDNVPLDSPLSNMLRKLEDSETVDITNIVANDLSNEDVRQIVEDVLQLLKENSSELADLIFKQTGGNLCYIVEFFRWLLDGNFLEFNPDLKRWDWEQEEISLSTTGGSVDDFMLNKLQHLPDSVKEVLKVSSCLGSVNEALLRVVLDFDVTAAVEMSFQQGILLLDEQSRTYAFTHGVAQKAAYALINKEHRSRFHLMIGRRLWQRLDEANVNKNIFTIIGQYCFGGNLVEDKAEKVAIAGLCLLAGKKAAKSSTFRTASVYLNFGIGLLGAISWKENYELTLELHNAAAEMELCTANFVRMDELLNAVFANAHHSHEKFQAFATRIYALGMRDQQQQAIQEGKHVLRHLGETFPNRFEKISLLSEMIRIKLLLRRKSDAMLLRLPHMEDSNMLSAMQILDLMFLSSFISTPSFLPFVVLKMMKITLQYGASAWTATAFSSYGMICCTIGDFDQGFRFGQLALEYLKKFQCREFLPRVYFGVYGCIHGWKKPLWEVIEPLRYAHRVGLETGDFEFSFLNSHLVCLSSVQAGVSLIQIEKDIKAVCQLMAAQRHESLLQLAMAFLQTLHHFMGHSDDPLSLVGDIMDVGKAIDHATETCNTTLKMALLSQRTILSYVFGAYDQANELAEKWRQFRFPSGPDQFTTCLFDGLVAAAAVRQHKDQRRKQMRIVDSHIKSYNRWAKTSPHNCLDKLFLLEAERASIQGHNELAYQHYICSNALAMDSKCVWVQALANEKAGDHLRLLGEDDLARPFYHRACDLFEEWGAYAKVRQLKDKSYC